jgi:hypothetical protein
MNFQELLTKEWFRLAGMLIIGIVIGVVFYPTKRIEEKMTQKHEQEIVSLKEIHSKQVSSLNESAIQIAQSFKSYKEETDKKYSLLKSENKELKSKQKTAYYKLIKPDGTIEIKKFTENEVSESSKVITSIQEEFKTKISEIETKWESIHKERVLKIQKQFDSKEEEYKKTIDTLTKSKVTVINEKKSSVDIGLTNKKDYFLHAGTTIAGPITGNVLVEQRAEDLSKQQPKEIVGGISIGIIF